MIKPIQCYKMTFEAIMQVRIELARIPPNHVMQISDALQRLSELYASIDAPKFIECMNELEAQTNVVKVDFKQTIKKAK